MTIPTIAPTLSPPPPPLGGGVTVAVVVGVTVGVTGINPETLEVQVASVAEQGPNLAKLLVADVDTQAAELLESAKLDPPETGVNKNN